MDRSQGNIDSQVDLSAQHKTKTIISQTTYRLHMQQGAAEEWQYFDRDTNRDTYYPDSLLFVSAGILSRISSQRLNWSYSWPLNRYEDDRTELYSCSSRCRGTSYIWKYFCFVYVCNVSSRGVSYQCNRCSGWVHAKCSGLLNAAQYRRSSDLTPPPTPSPPPIPTPHTPQVMTERSTFYSSTQMQLVINWQN